MRYKANVVFSAWWHDHRLGADLVITRIAIDGR
jgi:hypothetical protein